MGRAIGSKNVSAVEFASCVKRVSDAEGSLQDVADALGLKVTSVATRLSQLRKRVSNVPNFKRGGGGGGAKLDVSAIEGIFSGNGIDESQPSTKG